MKRKIKRILHIAQNSNEFDFHKDPQYLEIKSINLKKAEITFLLDQFKKLNYYDECIFWSKKLLKISDVCNKTEHFACLATMVKCYNIKKDNEMVIKFGKDAISIFHRTKCEISVLHNLHLIVGASIMQLNNYPTLSNKCAGWKIWPNFEI